MLNTKYGNGFSETHETGLSFWEVVKDFGEPEKCKLIKFVTNFSSLLYHAQMNLKKVVLLYSGVLSDCWLSG